MALLSRRRWATTLLALVLGLGASLTLGMLLGSEAIPPGRLWEALVSGGPSPDPVRTILLEVRLPRVLLAAGVGATLALVGAVLQGLFRNPLADPYLLGISGGAALGVTLGLLAWPEAVWVQVLGVPGMAALGALGALVLVYRLGLRQGILFVPDLLLAGVALGVVFSALILVITALADPLGLSRVLFWMLGHVGGATWPRVGGMTLLFLVGGWLLIRQALALNQLALGEAVARTLGTDVERLKRVLFGLSALLTGGVVALAGPIGFVGLLVPHILRRLLGADHRLLLPASALGGGIFLVLADAVARVVLAPAEMPVGVVTALCGGPLFLVLLRRRQGGTWGGGRRGTLE